MKRKWSDIKRHMGRERGGIVNKNSSICSKELSES